MVQLQDGFTVCDTSPITDVEPHCFHPVLSPKYWVNTFNMADSAKILNNRWTFYIKFLMWTVLLLCNLNLIATFFVPQYSSFLNNTVSCLCLVYSNLFTLLETLLHSQGLRCLFITQFTPWFSHGFSVAWPLTLPQFSFSHKKVQRHEDFAAWFRLYRDSWDIHHCSHEMHYAGLSLWVWCMRAIAAWSHQGQS